MLEYLVAGLAATNVERPRSRKLLSQTVVNSPWVWNIIGIVLSCHPASEGSELKTYVARMKHVASLRYLEKTN